MPADKLKPYNDPRVSLRSANLNGHSYGYLYSPASTTVPHRGTIVLIHGFPDISFGWRYQIPFLTGLGLDVIAPDCMGYGRTDSPLFSLKNYTYKRVSDDIAELCRQLGLKHIILGGHDWGGAIVYRVTHYYPDLITAVFSVCTPYAPPTTKYEPLGQMVKNQLPNFAYQMHFASGELEENIQSKTEIRQYLNNMYGARTPEGEVAFEAHGRVDFERQRRVGKTKLLDDDEMDYYVNEYARHGLNGPLNWYRVREENYMDEWTHFFDEGRKSRQDAIRELTFKQEFLFVLATKDQTLKPFMAAKMGERIPNLTRREVNAGHWALWQKPEECNKIIGDWLHEKVFSQASGGGKSKL